MSLENEDGATKPAMPVPEVAAGATGSAPILQVFTDSSWCNDGTPNHDWQGWYEHPDGLGGERICAKCGMGAMHHSLMTGP